jgi:hypothetical protein
MPMESLGIESRISAQVMESVKISTLRKLFWGMVHTESSSKISSEEQDVEHVAMIKIKMTGIKMSCNFMGEKF